MYGKSGRILDFDVESIEVSVTYVGYSVLTSPQEPRRRKVLKLSKAAVNAACTAVGCGLVGPAFEFQRVTERWRPLISVLIYFCVWLPTIWLYMFISHWRKSGWRRG